MGIDNLKSLTAVVDSTAELLLAAKADDGKVTATDLLDKDVWDEAFDVVSDVKDLLAKQADLEAEVKDLDSNEVMELCLHYMKSMQGLYKAMKA